MRKVKFPLVKDGAVIVYPDDMEFFSRTRNIDGVMYGTYSGSDTSIENSEMPSIPLYKTRVTFGELRVLIEEQAYAKIYRAAYPQGNKPEDDSALYFFESAKNPSSSDGLIDVTAPLVTGALDYFIIQNYATDDDKTRIQQGVPIS